MYPCDDCGRAVSMRDVDDPCETCYAAVCLRCYEAAHARGRCAESLVEVAA